MQQARGAAHDAIIVVMWLYLNSVHDKNEADDWNLSDVLIDSHVELFGSFP